jgi:hypothetical protein
MSGCRPVNYNLSLARHFPVLDSLELKPVRTEGQGEAAFYELCVSLSLLPFALLFLPPLSVLTQNWSTACSTHL